MADSELPTNLKRRAVAWAGQLTSLAKSYAPAHVRAAISSRVEEAEDHWIIRITADRKIAPDARAQEYGSGMEARRGDKHYIQIAPKNGKALAFKWEGHTDPPILSDGRVIVPIVRQHPGINAANGGKGYIAPAVNELKARARAELSIDVRQAIADDIRRSFGKA